MNKYFAFSAMSLALLTAACSQEDSPIDIGDGELTTFSIGMPQDFTTRAFGQNITDDMHLYVAVYRIDGENSKTLVMSNFNGENNQLNESFLSIQGSFAGGASVTCSMPLLKENKYDILFWAQDKNATGYTFNPSKGSIEVNYTNMTNFDDKRNAFYTSLLNFTTGSKVDPLTLTRPFAQINIGASDVNTYLSLKGIENQTFGINVTSLYDTLSLIDGAVSSSTGKTVAGNIVPSALSTTAYPVGENEEYLAMGYFLVGNKDATAVITSLDITVGVDAEVLNTIPNVPAGMNLRTNVYGQLLTSQSNFQISIEDGFGGQDLAMAMKWDGSANESPSIVTPEGSTPIVTISTPEQFAYYATSPDIQQSLYSNGMKVIVTKDMDFSGHPWTPIQRQSNGNTGGAIEYDFQGHTLSGLDAPLFDNNACGIVKNVTLKDCKITRALTKYRGVLAGSFYGSIENVNIEDCTITYTYSGTESVSLGGIVGLYCSGDMTNCTVKNVTYNFADDDNNNPTVYIGGLVGTLLNGNDGTTIDRYFRGISVSGFIFNYNSGILSKPDYVKCGQYIGRVSKVKAHVPPAIDKTNFTPEDWFYEREVGVFENDGSSFILK